MDNMCVYRVECAAGKGFYASAYFETHHGLLGGTSRPEHPIPEEDSMYWVAYEARKALNPLHWIGHQIFGFASLEALRRWFYNDQWLQGMHQAMRISVYECPVDDPVVGRTQLTFTRAKAKLVQRCLPSELLKQEPAWYGPDAEPALANEVRL